MGNVVRERCVVLVPEIGLKLSRDAKLRLGPCLADLPRPHLLVQAPCSMT
jgi:hypothetical protein